MKRLGILVTLLIAAVVVATSPALANCIPGKFGANAAYPYYSYIDFGNTSGSTVGFNGAFWQTNNPGVNNGTYPVTEWMFGYAGYTNYWYFYIQLGDARVVGCPAGAMTVQVEDTTTDSFIIWTVDELAGPSGLFDFDYTWVAGGGSSSGFFTAGASLRPFVNSSSRVGNNVELNVTVANPAAAHYAQTVGTIGGIELLSQQSATAPSPDAAGWVTVGSLPATGGTTTVAVDCTTTTHQWLGAGLLINDGTTDQPVQIVSEAVEIECDPTHADPPANFKLIDRDTRPKGKKIKDR